MPDLTDQMMSPPRHAPSRRSVVRAAAWSVPVVSIAAAAPAYACSPASATTVNYLLDWGVSTYTKNSASSGTATVTAPNAPSAAAVTMTVTSATTGTITRDATNLTVEDVTDIGDLGDTMQGLSLHHTGPVTAGRANRQTVTFGFDRPVSGLSFTITDIDSRAYGWDDAVELSGPRSFAVNTYQNQNNQTRNYVIGSGVQNDPWLFMSADQAIDTNDSRGNVRVTYTAPVSSITLVYWSYAGGSNQRLWLSDFAFSASSC